ncbi:MAG: hypothetical protein JXB50_01190 [Spirochaetes bacterium]|nr:hypothetical protein [Spirochaetota bacterium]
MDIYINDEKINFKLENEKNASDIINALNEYSANLKPQHFITQIYINDNEYSFTDDKNLKKIEINQIKNLKIEISNIYEITEMSIKQIEKFLILLKNLLTEKKPSDNSEKIKESIDWMKDGINQISMIFDSKDEKILEHKNNFLTNCENLNNFFNEFNINVNTDKTKINSALLYLNNLDNSLSNIKNWLIKNFKIPNTEYIINSLDNLIDEIDKIVPKLENVALLYQTGEDSQTMDIIQNLANILEKSISLFIVFKESFKIKLDKYSFKEVNFDTYFKTITDHLKMLMEAIQNKDFVVISDLLEYEFVPNIEEIKKILLKIKEEAFTKAN